MFRIWYKTARSPNFLPEVEEVRSSHQTSIKNGDIDLVSLGNVDPTSLLGVSLRDLANENSSGNAEHCEPDCKTQPEWILVLEVVGNVVRVETPTQCYAESGDETEVVKAIIVVDNAVHAATCHASGCLDEHEDHEDEGK
jgi:hypothetical protein